MKFSIFNINFIETWGKSTTNFLRTIKIMSMISHAATSPTIKGVYFCVAFVYRMS